MVTSENSEGHRFRLPLFELSPGRRLMALRVSVDIGEQGLDVAGALAPVAPLGDLLRAGARVLGFMCNWSDDHPSLACCGVLDLSESALSPDEVAEKLRLSGAFGGVEALDLGDGFAGLRGCTLHVGGAGPTRAFVTGESTLRGILLGLRENFGEAAGSAMLYYIGVYAGRERVRELVKELGRDAALEANWGMLEAMGWAASIRALGSPDGNYYRLEVDRLVECDVLSGRLRGRTSHMFRGIIAGSLSEALGGEWDVEEVECINDGSDRCAFEARRRR